MNGSEQSAQGADRLPARHKPPASSRPSLKRFQAIGGMALLGMGLLAAVASGGGPDATISGEAVALSSVGVGMMLSGLGLVTHADNSDREATLHRRPSAARTGHVSGERF